MRRVSRREFGKTLAAAGLAVSADSVTSFAVVRGKSKVVVIGGGAGGATVASALKQAAAEIDVTLIERERVYNTPFFSNLYLGGLRSLSSLNQGYDGLRKLGVNVVFDRAVDVNHAKRAVKTESGREFHYDRLVLSPGIDIKYDSIVGYSREVSATLPQAYSTDTAQRLLLKRQLEAMRDGGVVLLTMPSAPYRCPVGPYERACMIAHYLKNAKPKSKVVMLDSKERFPMQPAFADAFDNYYRGIIELHLSTPLDDFTVVRVDARAREVEVKGGGRWKGDVINLIPQHRAGEIAVRAGCADGDWCPVKPESFLSTKVANIYVIGDSASALPIPKTAVAAVSQAKVVAASVLADLANRDRFPARYQNICMSLLAPDDMIKVGAEYAPAGDKITESGEYNSRRTDSAEIRKNNCGEGDRWYSAITAEMFAKSATAEPTGRG